MKIKHFRDSKIGCGFLLLVSSLLFSRSKPLEISRSEMKAALHQLNRKCKQLMKASFLYNLWTTLGS